MLPKLIIIGAFCALLAGCDKFEAGNKSGERRVNSGFDVGSSTIPYMVINTEDAILNEPKVQGEMSIYVKGALRRQENVGIEFRGSSSFRNSDKKSYGLEIQDEQGSGLDVSLFGFPQEEDFILSGHIVNYKHRYYNDYTLIYHYLGYDLFRRMGRYASRSKLLELEINGDYKGVYVFMEKLKRDKKRIRVKKLEPDYVEPSLITGGYILKIDKTTGGSDWDRNLTATFTPTNSFRSRFDANRELVDFAPYGKAFHEKMHRETYFIYEYPKATEITDVQKEYIQNYIDRFEVALLSDDFSTDERTYTDYIDVDSFIDFIIINEICRNIDGYRLSTYMHKDRGGKLTMGPIWDLNVGFDGNGRIPIDDWILNYNKHEPKDVWNVPFWWPRLMEDPQFTRRLKQRWAKLRKKTLSTTRIHDFIDETSRYLIDNGAVERNYKRWDLGWQMHYPERIHSLKTFITARSAWLDTEIAQFD